ncbi:YjjW family glycine radical enzyme activase [Photobacterium iliopiscarium]|uniref:YjjW family glycine radical enzyme activase n=1 Tax=Photobacterium iliopiscarium TaxID=56192 RepID=UPI001E51A9D2|nr:YjjW family glycine radical enzyme activase [Photobacterium iliopiscarium]MCD9465791.1 glycine radical enzyme activase [Photobacterium iliopiscarium]MCD9487270.1 YjjW family glycine radical enzyme activase [Photobacterium iliopiscarium]MCF2244527.1 YjjW family glycine radical enzyme activase [Photobacterium iliopiscarium]
MISATVSKILNYSCVDGPGNRMVLFLQGCNYRCKNCHNPQTIDMCNQCGDCVPSCPTQSLQLITQFVVWNMATCTECDTCLTTCNKQSTPKTYTLTVTDTLELIRDNIFFINGITVTGGEATLQLPYIIALFKAIKSDSSLQHLSCMIDSNGSLSITGWQSVSPYIDGAMIDLKAWNNTTHRWLTGRDNDRVLASISWLSQHQKLYEVRLLQIPEITDYEQYIDDVAAYLTTLNNDVRIKLNAFQHHGVTGESLNWATCNQADIETLAMQLTERNITNLILPTVYA